jgi:chemotaxis protein MotB
MAGRRRRGHEEAHGNQERWLLTYADLITLLMVFFVVLYSLGKADVAKFARLQASIQRAFRVEVLRGNDPTSLRGQDGSNVPTSVISEAVAQRPSSSQEQGLVSTLEELRRALVELPENERAKEHVRVGLARDGVVISLSGNVLFDSGRADLKAEGLVLLDELADRLAKLPNEVRIEGHTDDVPISTPLYPSNWELSSARATTVARYLVEHKVAPDRLIAAGYGEYRPAAPNDTREGRARNRRVDVVIISASPATARAETAAEPEAHP